jgi:hypothetical protein
MAMTLAMALAGVGAGAAGCGDDGPECRIKADCPPGEACVLGQCRPEVGPDAGSDAAVNADADAAGDAGSDAGDDAGTPDSGVCEFVDDGVVNRDELVFEVGLGATYRVNDSAPVTVDVVGTGSGGQRYWDFSGSTASDRSVVDELLPLTGAWYAADYPTATYVAWLDEGLGTLGVFRVTDQALQMLGVVSETPDETNLRYDPPVDLLRFPLAEQDTWLVETTSSGFLNHGWTQLEETYQLTVDAAGTVVVPAGSFRALRVRTDFEQHVPFTLIYTERILYLWITECFGIVARITSQDDETDPQFTQAAEYRRMTL